LTKFAIYVFLMS